LNYGRKITGRKKILRLNYGRKITGREVELRS
jgi:hypothetical protein